MNRDNKKGMKLLTGILVGATAGYVAGLLFAPKKGTEVRKDIKDFSEKLRDDASSYIMDIKEKSESLLNKGKRNIRSFENKTEDKLINFLDETKKKTAKPIEDVVQNIKKTADNAQFRTTELSNELKNNIQNNEQTYTTNSLFERIKDMQND